MSIKTKLVLSYIAMLLAPLIIFVLITNLIAARFMGDTIPKNTFSLEMTMKVNPKLEKPFETMIAKGKLHPKLLEDKTYLRRLERSVPVTPHCEQGIIVKKGNYIIYTAKRFNRPEIIKRLPRFGYLDETQEIKANGRVYNIEQFFFYYPDGSPGSFFIIVDVNPLHKVFLNMTTAFLLAFLIILIVVNGVLTFLVSRSIIKPLKALKSASEQIKEGNLDCPVKAYSKDELGDLAQTFESMRAKLKESVIKQIQYENNRKELLTSISHDLKTPITCIKGYVEGMLDGIADTPEKMNLYMRTIRNKATELDHLIGDLFLFSKLDLMKQPFNFETLDIKAYLEDFVEETQFGMAEIGFKISFETDCISPVHVIADRLQLNRVINNIVQNAFKYMDETRSNPEIRIELMDSSDVITVAVHDNGQGIREEDLPFIFDRFYRTDPARNSATGGSGLGLAIVKLIIEGHSGRIWAESKYGLGTSIFFTLKKVKGGTEHEKSTHH